MTTNAMDDYSRKNGANPHEDDGERYPEGTDVDFHEAHHGQDSSGSSDHGELSELQGHSDDLGDLGEPQEYNPHHDQAEPQEKKKASKLILLVPVAVLTLMGGFMLMKIMGGAPTPNSANSAQKFTKQSDQLAQGTDTAATAAPFPVPSTTPKAQVVPASSTALAAPVGLAAPAMATPVTPQPPVVAPTIAQPQMAAPAIAQPQMATPVIVQPQMTATVTAPIPGPAAAPSMAVVATVEPVVAAVPSPALPAPVAPTPAPSITGGVQVVDAASIDRDLAAAEAQLISATKKVAELRAARAKSGSKPTHREGDSPRKQVVKANAPVKQVVAIVPVTKVVAEKKAKGGIRTDFAVYAIVDGRAWVTSIKEKINYTVAIGESLPDGSVVQELIANDTKLEVKTSKGPVLSESKVSSALARQE